MSNERNVDVFLSLLKCSEWDRNRARDKNNG